MQYAINRTMNTRKRKHSTAGELQQTSSKRAELLSQLWSSGEKPSTADKTSTSSSTNSLGTVDQIEAIIGERGDEYLIDWANDPVTGESFEPDWVSYLLYLKPFSLCFNYIIQESSIYL